MPTEASPIPPNANFSGLDSLVYQVCDNGTPSLCDTAILRITVTAANDAPVAVDDNVNSNRSQIGTGNVLTNDTDPEGDCLTAKSGNRTSKMVQ